MPHKGYTGILTGQEIIDLFRAGKYELRGEHIYNNSGKKLSTFQGSNRSTTPYVRIYALPKYVTTAVARVVWMVCTGCPIPDGFEIHHKNGDDTDNRRENLMCLHATDHRILHAESMKDVPF